MSELFRLEKEIYSEIHQERQWTYACLSPFTFNRRTITKITITDHFLLEHKDVITKELILEFCEVRLNGEMLKPLPESYLWSRDTFRFENYYRDKKYRLIFWYNDHNPQGLWIRNCYPL